MASKILYMLLKCSLKASVIILVVMALRPLLKKVSHSVTCLLWAAVGLALACPVPLATRWSVFPGMMGSSEKLYEKIDTVTNVDASSEVVEGPGSRVVSGMMNTAGAVGNQQDMVGIQASTITNQPDQGFCDNLLSQVSVWLHGLTMADYILAFWLVGMCAILIYALVRYIKLKKRMEISVKLRDNIYECDEIVSPFVMGLVNPKIYLPSNLESELRSSVLLHEQAHVARHDQLWKYASLILLAIHWFNPLAWASYVLFGRDMELACDERVIREMDVPEKQGYAVALLSCSVKGRYAIDTPLAFAQIGVKERVVAMTKYQKPKMLAFILSVALCAGLVGCSLTESGGKQEHEGDQSGDAQETEVSEDLYEVQYNTPVKMAVNDATMNQFGYSRNERLLYADDESVVVLVDDGIYRYMPKAADRIAHGIAASFSLDDIDQGGISGVDSCEIFMESNGRCVFLHPFDQPFMYIYDFYDAGHVQKVSFNLTDQEVISGPFETNYTAANGDVYTLEGTGGQLKDLCYTVTGGRSETRHFFRGEIEVDVTQKYLPHNQTKYGESAYFTEEEFDLAAEQIAEMAKNWTMTSPLHYLDSSNCQNNVDWVNLWAADAGLKADFNQALTLEGQFHADSGFTVDGTEFEAGEYEGLWIFGKNPAGDIILFSSNIYGHYEEDDESYTGEYEPKEDEENILFRLKYSGAGDRLEKISGERDIPGACVFTEEGECANGSSYVAHHGTDYEYSFYGKKDASKFYVITPRIFRKLGDDNQKTVQIKDGKVTENDYIKVKNLSLEKDKNDEYSILIELDRDTPYYPMYLGVQMDGYRRVSNGTSQKATFDLVDGTFNYKYEYLYRIELKTDEEAKAKAILKDGEFYFTVCYELCSDEHYALTYADPRIELVKEKDMNWCEDGVVNSAEVQ